MPMDDTQLEESLVWEQDGCLAEPALHAVADGELEILPQAAREHAHSCSGCSERIGQIAMFSLEVEQALSARLAAQPSALQLQAAGTALRQKLPVVPIGLALLVALTCNLPLLRQLDPNALRRSAGSLLHMLVPMLLKLIGVLAHSNFGSALMFCSAAFLLGGSALLARSGWAGRAASIRRTGGRA
jgi:hypothetical protein